MLDRLLGSINTSLAVSTAFLSSEPGTLTAVEAKLDPQRFLRVHRSWIVNLDYVREAQPWSKGTWILLTRGGLQIHVGEQYRDALRKILE